MLGSERISRRLFFGGAAASAFAFTFVRRDVLGGEGKPSANEKLNIACIGVGGKGGGDVGGVSSENIVALCDVDDKRGEGSFKRHPKAKKFKDFRIMLQEMNKQIDAVTVSTADHCHAPASMMAMKMGKHVFCQKPLTHSIFEAREITKAAKAAKVATLMGIQGHASEQIRLISEWVWGGVLGQVREVYYWTNRPIWPQGIDKPKDTPACPPNLDWGVWLGPAPERPYHPAYHPFAWRGWWDFGSGALGDIACHAMDAAFWALKLGEAKTLEMEAVSSPVNNETAPKWSQITFYYPARGDMAPVKVVWNDGCEDKSRPKELAVPRPKDLEPDRKLPGGIGGQLFIGDKATILAGVYADGVRIIPEAKFKELKSSLPAKTIPRSPGHYQEWIRACKGGEPAGANFADYAGPLTEMVLLGNLAVRTGKKVVWDSEQMKVTNVPEANKYVAREYRKGWTL